MFRHKLLDPEDEKRQRVRRARIVRRNRIKREVTRGLPLRRPRLPRAFDVAFDLDSEEETNEWNRPTSPFRPIFGGDSNDEALAVTPVRLVSQQVTLPRKSELSSTTIATSTSSRPGLTKRPRSTCPRIRAKWRNVFQELIFQRHEEILAKDPNRKWRQERFGLLLFAKREYARASEHLNMAIRLGATSGLCWRRLAESYLYIWETGGDWKTLWTARATCEEALTRVEVASDPHVLRLYAKVLELLGSYTGALTICTLILQMFPKFELLREVKFRFVLLQRYQLFSSSSYTDAATTNLAVLTKCIAYTQELLLDKAITEGSRYTSVLYMHARLNEMAAELSSDPMAGNGKQSANVDLLFQELYKVARVTTSEIAAPPGIKWKSWKSRYETYTAFAAYFRAQSENILTSDALSRAVELLEAQTFESYGSSKIVDLWRNMTEEQQNKRLSLYVALASNYYQCNQMERAIRSMETVYDLNPLHAEARASLVEWFPAKWQYRLELEDASQVQIARVLRGIWGRKKALIRRHEAQRVAERRYRENPYHLGCRQLVLQMLRDKYSSLFAAQDIAARCIQRIARRYLSRARVRWKIEDERKNVLHDLNSKQQTWEYCYDRHVRNQLVALLPHEYEHRFLREDCSALRIQRCFRGRRARKEFWRLRDIRRQHWQRQHDGANRIQLFYHRYCRSQVPAAPAVDDLLFKAQQNLARSKKRLAAMLERLYHRWKYGTLQENSTLLCILQTDADVQHQAVVEHTSAIKIQLFWRRYASGQLIGGHISSDAQVRQAEQLFLQQQTLFEVFDGAARQIQALWRDKRCKFLRMLQDRVPAPPCASSVGALISKCELNHKNGIETLVEFDSIKNLDKKRALFDHPVVVLRGLRVSSRPSSPSSDESFSFQHVASAIQYSSVLRTLICASGAFESDQILTVLHALRTRKSLRVFALGKINIVEEKKLTHEDPDRANSDNRGQSDVKSTGVSLCLSVNGQSLSTSTFPTSSPLHERCQLSAMEILSKTLCTSNFLLEELYLEQNNLLKRPQDGAVIAGIVADYFFARYGRLHTLVIAHMQFSDENGVLLGRALAINTVLQQLDLHGNVLCDGAAIAIANDGLAHNSSLRFLNLAENRIGSVGGKALFRCLGAHNRSLQTLVLRNNLMMSDVMAPLISAWQLNAVIASVDLAGNLIDDDSLKAIQTAVMERHEVAEDCRELRLLVARKRFGIQATRPSLGGILSSLSSSGKLHDCTTAKTSSSPLSPKKWLSVNAVTTISPIVFPTRQRNEGNVTGSLSVVKVFARARRRKLLHAPPASLALSSKLPALSAPLQKKHLAW